MHAIVLPLLSAIGAAAAPRIRHDDVVAGRKAAHGAADGVHDAGAFVAVNGGVRAVEIAVAAVQIGLAHAAGHDADDHLVRPRLAQLHGLDGERARPFADDGGFDLHGRLLAHCGNGARLRQFLPASICASTAAVGQQSTFSPLRF